MPEWEPAWKGQIPRWPESLGAFESRDLSCEGHGQGDRDGVCQGDPAVQRADLGVHQGRHRALMHGDHREGHRASMHGGYRKEHRAAHFQRDNLLMDHGLGRHQGDQRGGHEEGHRADMVLIKENIGLCRLIAGYCG